MPTTGRWTSTWSPKRRGRSRNRSGRQTRCAVINALDGLTSRCTSPAAWAVSSAAASCSMTLNRQLRAHRPVAFQQAVQVDPLDDRHRQIQLALNFAGIVDRDDVRFGQPRGGIRLPAKPFAIPRLVPQLGGNTLMATCGPSRCRGPGTPCPCRPRRSARSAGSAQRSPRPRAASRQNSSRYYQSRLRMDWRPLLAAKPWNCSQKIPWLRARGQLRPHAERLTPGSQAGVEQDAGGSSWKRVRDASPPC